MPGRTETVLEERRRLGGWLTRKEAELIAFRKNLARKRASARAWLPARRPCKSWRCSSTATHCYVWT
jgi:hypothetical protein